MEYDIVKNPMGLIEFTLNQGEKVTAEARCNGLHSGKRQDRNQDAEGGISQIPQGRSAWRESFFVNEFIAEEDGCKLGLTGNMLGDIEVISVDEEFIVQSGAFVGSSGDLTLDTKWQGFTKGIFGSNMFMLKTVGTGEMFVNAWGGILKKELQSGERMILDNYQLVALSSTAEYRVTKHGSLKTTLFGGEALVIDITGPGIVYFQTKNLMEFVRSIVPFLPKRN